jgi:SPP1 gp7 family putative phage head morphogenesis protein
MQSARDRFARARRAEVRYGIQLRQIARQINAFVHGIFHPQDPATASYLERTLHDYEDTIRPWAESVGRRMLVDVSQRDFTAWLEHGKAIGRALRGIVETAPIGNEFRQLQDTQVDLITSIPRDAAQRVHDLSLEHLLQGRRWEEVARDILDQGDVSRSKANLIARTETSRAAGQFTMVRAMHMGSEGYIWRTVRDADVRLEHRKLEGTFQRWDSPPVAGYGRGHSEQRYHPGGGPNCRCMSEPVMPDEPQKGY